jgi:hypothetical protein
MKIETPVAINESGSFVSIGDVFSDCGFSHSHGAV